MVEQKRLTSSHRKGGARRFLAIAAALAVSLTGLVATPATTATAASSSSTGCGVNPMAAATPNGSENGYTVFARENAVFANSETEGTIAVGGTATFGDPRGNQSQQYPIMHGGVGGNADYSVPTIDGQPNRVLIQKFKSNNKVVQVKAQGAVGSDAEAGAKIADQTTPADYTFGQMFGGSGTTFFPADGNNMSPQIESFVQPWTNLADAQSSWGTNGDVLSYFPDDNGQTVLQSFSNWQPVEAPASNDQTITLSSDGPSKLPLSAFDGIDKYKLANYSETSFLVITVSAGDVVNGRVNLPSYSFAGKDSADKEGISHILFDLSALTGDVELTTANEPVRGSVYAPSAHVIFPAESDGGREFEGQIIAQSVTALQGGKEIHTNVFKGRFECGDQPSEPNEGTFNLRKILSGIDATNFPAGTTFPVTATWDGGTKTFDLPADGTVVPSGITLPEGTTVTLTEGDLPTTPDGYTYVSNEPSAETITIYQGDNNNIAWSVTNTYEKDVTPTKEGTFNLRKILSGIDATNFPAGTTFPVTATWDGGTKTFDLPADGTVVPSGITLPEGTTVTLTEGDLPTTPDGYTYVSNEPSAETITIYQGDNNNIAWSVTNTYKTQKVSEGGFDLAKTLKGVTAADFPEDTVFTVTATWSIDGTENVREFKLPVDGSLVAGPHDLPAGTEVTFDEVDVPEIAGHTFTAVEFSAQTLTIEAGETVKVSAVNTYKKTEKAIDDTDDDSKVDNSGDEVTNGPEDDELAKTGASTVTTITLAGLLLLSAGGVLLVTRRRLAQSGR
ncbi:LPXTG-motif cell wall anchor domain-containing protein/choice-of-anchor A domain-containing protein [Micrococcales bacterium KH10]|nr:LPXTG-motif cell wall anchor domain-containing protein/choice-of-anchor A domain-containing protein [Micrococcales bacterium KH10]